MLEQTIRLFITALIIGILVNIGLQQVLVAPSPNENRTIQHRQLLLSQSPTDTDLHYSDQTAQNRQKDIVANFIRASHIDSLPKLRFLFLLYQHLGIKGTRQEFAKRWYLGDPLLLEEIIADLQRAGLVDCVENCYKLRDEPEVRSCLQHLTKAFEDPLTRQEILH